MVTVLDGGVVTGPAGSSVLVTAIAAGGTICPAGGARVTQLSDGGISNVCNGLAGAAGAAGPQGAKGATGSSGTNGTNGSNGSTGATGATGSTGAMGMQGSAGDAGPPGPIGPQGPAGSVMYLDGGVVGEASPVQFAGFTAASYSGNLGGSAGANAKCQAEFSGSYFCTVPDYSLSNTTAVPGASGAWVDFARQASGERDRGSCNNNGAWTVSSTSIYGAQLNAFGANYATDTCATSKRLACCRGGAAPTIFRGFTTATYSGNLGGAAGANAKCQAEFSGSYFCTVPDYSLANSAAVPGAAGAWIDYTRQASGERDHGSCNNTGAWTIASTSIYGGQINQSGSNYASDMCTSLKPLACCQSR
jgi:hypothetical protein